MGDGGREGAILCALIEVVKWACILCCARSCNVVVGWFVDYTDMESLADLYSRVQEFRLEEFTKKGRASGLLCRNRSYLDSGDA